MPPPPPRVNGVLNVLNRLHLGCGITWAILWFLIKHYDFITSWVQVTSCLFISKMCFIRSIIKWVQEWCHRDAFNQVMLYFFPINASPVKSCALGHAYHQCQEVAITKDNMHSQTFFPLIPLYIVQGVQSAGWEKKHSKELVYFFNSASAQLHIRANISCKIACCCAWGPYYDVTIFGQSWVFLWVIYLFFVWIISILYHFCIRQSILMWWIIVSVTL